VIIESGFIFPPGLDVEEARIARRTECIDRYTARFSPRWTKNLSNGDRDQLPLTRSREGAREHE
jgi:hypothetical protein